MGRLTSQLISPHYLMNKRLGGPQNLSLCFKEENLMSLPGHEPQITQPIACLVTALITLT
jgi:hypothetical protein